MYDTLDLVHDTRGVVTLWLAREGKHNALSARMIAELTHAAADLAADSTVRVVVLAARGKSFCAGGDLAAGAVACEAVGALRAGSLGAAGAKHTRAGQAGLAVVEGRFVVLKGRIVAVVVVDAGFATEAVVLRCGHVAVVRFGLPQPGGVIAVDDGAALRAHELAAAAQRIQIDAGG